MRQQTVLIGIWKIKKMKLQLFGWVMIQKIHKKFLINNYIKKFQKQQMVLKKLGIKKGDRVTIYFTMIPELAVLC